MQAIHDSLILVKRFLITHRPSLFPWQGSVLFTAIPVEDPLGVNLNFLALLKLLTGGLFSSGSPFGFLVTIWSVYSFLALLASGAFIFGIIYAYMRFNEIAQAIDDGHERAHALWKELHGGGPKNARWMEVQTHIDSGNPNDWKLAIIEADIMLGQVLHDKGYAGASIGEQLKSASVQNFRSLQDAWEAHKVRNQIAHEGADFILTNKVARETILQYQRVFIEFGAI